MAEKIQEIQNFGKLINFELHRTLSNDKESLKMNENIKNIDFQKNEKLPFCFSTFDRKEP